MNHLVAAAWKPVIASANLPERRLGRKIRFLTGITITLAGAGALLSDMMHLIASRG